MTNPVVLLHANDDGTVDTPFGRVGDIEPCVLISHDIIEWTRGADRPLCAFAHKALGYGGTARTEENALIVNAKDGQVVYELFPAQWDDGAGRISTSQIFLGVRRPITSTTTTE